MKRIIVIILVLLISSCSKNKQSDIEINDNSEKSIGTIASGGMEFTVKYTKPRGIYKIENHDLNNDGKDEVIVLSVNQADSIKEHFDFYNFDLIQIFSFDSAMKSFKKILSDTVDYATECKSIDLQKNHKPQILINTNYGGNDVIISKGMFVYNMISNDSVALVKYIDAGNPELVDLNADSNKELIVYDEFWGVMTQADVIYYIRDILKFNGNGFDRVNKDYQNFYNKIIDSAKAQYQMQKEKFSKNEKIKPSEYPFYRPIIEMSVNAIASGNVDAVRQFWYAEKDFLHLHLGEEQYTDILNFFNKYILNGSPIAYR
ncbi:MAG TPA: hypothetical protein VHP32_00880 [Ignavibacteria bacterium]|nr:hypothetical protein [Ignavibacteria bacterium]